jgi:hypothetical protein
MVAPVLNDFEYQYLDTGQLLGKQSDNAMPLFDITQVTGHDLPDFKHSTNDIDGSHGAFEYTTFVGSRLWVVAGEIFAEPVHGIEDYMELLKANFLPQASVQPFYFKQPNQVQKISYCKPLSFKYDLDDLRRIGQCVAQLQLIASDPRLYSASRTQAGNGTVTNNGSVRDYPTFSWGGGAGTFTGPDFSVTVAAGLAAGTYVLDLGSRRIVRSDGVDFSAFATGAPWGGLTPGSNAVTMVAGATMTYADAWL